MLLQKLKWDVIKRFYSVENTHTNSLSTICKGHVDLEQPIIFSSSIFFPTDRGFKHNIKDVRLIIFLKFKFNYPFISKYLSPRFQNANQHGIRRQPTRGWKSEKLQKHWGLKAKFGQRLGPGKKVERGDPLNFLKIVKIIGAIGA